MILIRSAEELRTTVNMMSTNYKIFVDTSWSEAELYDLLVTQKVRELSPEIDLSYTHLALDSEFIFAFFIKADDGLFHLVASSIVLFELIRDQNFWTRLAIPMTNYVSISVEDTIKITQLEITKLCIPFKLHGDSAILYSQAAKLLVYVYNETIQGNMYLYDFSVFLGSLYGKE